MVSFTQWFLEWAEGDPPIDERVYKTIEDNLHVGLYLTGIFLDMRPERRPLSLAGLIFALAAMFLYSWLAVVTVWIQKDDFSSASLSAAIALMIIFAIIFVTLMNIKRQEVIEFFRCLSVGYSMHKHDEVDEETVLVIAKSRRQKRIIITLIPGWLTVAGTIGIMGRAIDVYAGVAPNSTQVNGVYMMLPVPVWYPFEVTSEFRQYVALLGEMSFAGILVAAYIGMVIYFFVSLQSVAVQLKILKLRIRKLHQSAYKLHRRRGGRKLGQTQMFADHSFCKCYNECLNECVAHHQAIIKGFNHFRNSCCSLLDIGVVFCSILIATALLLLVVGGKPSVLALGFAAVFVEVSNITVVSAVADQVQILSGSLDADLYDTHWQQMGKQASSTMMIMLERCKQPLQLSSAIAHVPLNWETYGKVLNSAYSYLNLIIAICKNEN